MKRFLSFLMAAGLLLGSVACSEDKTEPDPTPGPGTEESVFPDMGDDHGFVSDKNAATANEMTEGESKEITFTPAAAWTLSVDEENGPIAEALKTRAGDDTTTFVLSDGKGNTATKFSGVASQTPLTYYLIINQMPTSEEAGVTATVSLEIGEDTQYYKAYVGSPNDAPNITASFAVYEALPIDMSNYERDLYQKDAEGNYIYAEDPTSNLVLRVDEYGENAPQTYFKVVSDTEWIINSYPFWVDILTPENGGVGETEVKAMAFDDNSLPIADETGEIVFAVDSEAADAAEISRINISIAGCGNRIELASRIFTENVLISATKQIYSEEDGQWWPLEEQGYCYVKAAYGSQIFLVSKENWLTFAEEIAWDTEEVNGVDPTKYGLQRVGGLLECEYGLDEARTAYLIGIPASVATAEGAAFSAEDALDENGALKEAYKPYVLFTATQKGGADDSLVTWAEKDDFFTTEAGKLYRPDFATLSAIRPAALEDPRTAYFTHDLATAPVAFELHYKNLLAGAGIFALNVPAYSTIEFLDEAGIFGTSDGQPVAWAQVTELDANTISLDLNYDYEKGDWKVELPAIDDWANFPAFFVLRDAEGQVITWIMLTLDPVDYEASDLIQGAEPAVGGTVQLFNLNEGEPGYYKEYAGVPQFKLEMINAAGVNFAKVPLSDSGSWVAYDVEGNDISSYFEWHGFNAFIIKIADDFAFEGYMIFLDGLKAPVAVLYIDYLYGEPETVKGVFGGESVYVPEGQETDGSVKLSELNEGDEGYDADWTGSQYLLEVKNATTVQFERFPNGIDDWHVDGDDDVKVEYQAGTLWIYTEKAEAEFDISFRKSGYNLVLMHVHYTNENGGEGDGDGDTDKTDYPFALDESSITAGAVVRRTTEDDEWYTPYAGDVEQWTLIATGDDDKVTFISFPEYTDLNAMGDSDYEYFEVLYTTGSMTSVALLGDAYGKETSAEYNVFIYGLIDGEHEEVMYRLHVRYNMDPSSKDSDLAFVLDESSITGGASVRRTTENDEWYKPQLADVEQWTLIANGSDDAVTFIAFPSVKNEPMVLTSEDYNYFELNPQGKMMSVMLLGDAYGKENSAEYDVVFYDDQWGDAVYQLHVRYNVEGGSGEVTPSIPFALDESSITAGATVRPTTESDPWFNQYVEPDMQWSLIVNSDDDKVIFRSFPSVKNEPMVLTSTDYNYFELNPQGNLMSVMLLGDAWGQETSAEYDVIFYDDVYDDAVYRLHVRYNVDGSSSEQPGEGGGETSKVAFALDDSSIAAGAVVRPTTEDDEWYTPYAGDAEQWTLILNGNDDMVTFTSFPEYTDINAIGDSDYEYFEVLYSTGSMTSVALLGDAYGKETSAEYNVFIYGKVDGYEEVTHRLHVRYNMGTR